MSVTAHEKTTFTAAEDSSDGESIATSESGDDTTNDDTDDDDSFVDEEEVLPKKQKSANSTLKTEKRIYKFVQFNSDATKTLRPFKATDADTSFTVVKINRPVESSQLHCYLENNLDYSIVKSKSGNLFRAVYCKELTTFAVLAASVFDNTAVQTVLNKQTAVRKSKEICEFSLDTTKPCPSNFVKLAKKLDLDKGGMVFSTITAKMYLEKAKSTPVPAVQVKRSADEAKSSVDVPCKRVKTEKPFLVKLKEIAKEGYDKKHSLETCQDFIEKVYKHAAFSKTLNDLGCQ